MKPQLNIYVTFFSSYISLPEREISQEIQRIHKLALHFLEHYQIQISPISFLGLFLISLNFLKIQNKRIKYFYY